MLFLKWILRGILFFQPLAILFIGLSFSNEVLLMFPL